MTCLGTQDCLPLVEELKAFDGSNYTESTHFCDYNIKTMCAKCVSRERFYYFCMSYLHLYECFYQFNFYFLLTIFFLQVLSYKNSFKKSRYGHGFAFPHDKKNQNYLYLSCGMFERSSCLVTMVILYFIRICCLEGFVGYFTLFLCINYLFLLQIFVLYKNKYPIQKVQPFSL